MKIVVQSTHKVCLLCWNKLTLIAIWHLLYLASSCSCLYQGNQEEFFLGMNTLNGCNKRCFWCTVEERKPFFSHLLLLPFYGTIILSGSLLTLTPRARPTKTINWIQRLGKLSFAVNVSFSTDVSLCLEILTPRGHFDTNNGNSVSPFSFCLSRPNLHSAPSTSIIHAMRFWIKVSHL